MHRPCNRRDYTACKELKQGPMRLQYTEKRVERDEARGTGPDHMGPHKLLGFFSLPKE